MKQKKIIIFQARIACIGGVETHLFNLSLALKDYYNVVVLYDTCPNQEHIRRLKEIVDVEKYDESKTYECDICIRNSIFRIMPNNIIANRYIEMLHADYEWLNKNAILNEWDKAEKIGCGEFVAKQYKKVKGLQEDVKWIRNILAPRRQVDKVYHFISATRLDKYKGFERMLKMCDMLRENNIKFTWDVFTNSKLSIKLPEEFRLWSQRLDMFDFVADADYTVLLSDAEGLPYTIQESLQYGTPVICTDIGGCTELIKEGVNGYIVPLDMNFDINKIKNIPKFEEYNGTPVQEWLDELGGAVYIQKQIKRSKQMKVKVIKTFRDITNNLAYVNAETIYECDVERADKLQDMGLVAKILEAKQEEKIVEVERAVEVQEEKETAVVKKVAAKKPATKKVAAKKATK